MDILHLVDRLEDMINNSRAIPLTRNVVIDEDRFIEIIDQMRISIPDEIKKAQQLLAQRDRVLAQAQEEANRTIQLAKQKADEFAGRDAIVEAAQVRAEQIIAQSRIEAENIRADADEYVMDSLGTIEAELSRLLNQTRNGIAALGIEQDSRMQDRAVEMESYDIEDMEDSAGDD